MPVTRIPNHEELALEKPLQQYQYKTRFEGWLLSYIKQVQFLEDAIWDVILKRYLDYGEGVQLDVIGKIVGEPRKDRLDAEYKVYIRGRIRANISQGRPIDILEVLFILANRVPDGGFTDFLFDEYYPGAMLLEFITLNTQDDIEMMAAMLFDTKGGGLRLNIVAATVSEDLQFRWGDANDVDPVTGLLPVSNNGFGDADNLEEGYGLLSDAVTMPR